MPTDEPSAATRIGQRWPVALAILAVLLLLTLMPGRIRLFPAWLPYVAAAAVIAPMAAVALGSARGLWLRVEHAVTLLFCGLTGVGALGGLAVLIDAMVRRSGEISGTQLLSSSIAVWAINVLAFSLVYWQIDRGGPGARENRAKTRPDWLFPQEGAPPEDVPPDWRPTFVDYLYLGFSTATAFSTTEVAPLTSRAKLLMMLESTISLATIVVVASRAINILGN